MNTNNTTIIAAALAAVNENLTKDLIAKATPLIVRINSLTLEIECLDKQIASHRKELVALAGEKVDDSFLRGVEEGQSKTTVLAVIEKMNKDKQAQVEISAKNITASIDALQVKITNVNKQIVELRKSLLEIQPRTVTETTIVG